MRSSPACRRPWAWACIRSAIRRSCEDFEAVRLPIDIAEFHNYAVDWRAERVDFFVDGELVRSCPRPPTYPMQMMVAVFDFPDRSTGDDVTRCPS